MAPVDIPNVIRSVEAEQISFPVIKEVLAMAAELMLLRRRVTELEKDRAAGRDASKPLTPVAT